MEIVKLKDRICRSHEFYKLGVESMLQEFLHDVNRYCDHVTIMWPFCLSMESAKAYFAKEKYEASLPFTIEDIDGKGLLKLRLLTDFAQFSAMDYGTIETWWSSMTGRRLISKSCDLSHDDHMIPSSRRLTKEEITLSFQLEVWLPIN